MFPQELHPVTGACDVSANDMLQIVAVVMLGIGVLSSIFSLVLQLGIFTLKRRQRAATSLPPISVLKPLKGADDTLYENLASLARQDYPAFELVLGCEDISDPALSVAQRLRREFPELELTIVAGSRSSGLNPKVNNLRHIESAARYEHVLISDADVRVDPQYLRATIAEMNDADVGLVSNLIVGTEERSLGSTLDNLHLNTFVAETVCGAAVLAKHPCVVGKSMLFRRSDFQRLGGFDRVKDVLAEDYVTGQLFANAGYRVALSPYAVHAVNQNRSLRDFFARHVRWGQMRRTLAPVLYWGEPLLFTSLWFLLALGCGAIASSWTTVFAALVGLAFKSLCDGMFARVLSGQSLGLVKLGLIPLKDLAMVAIWLVGGLKTSVCWRGNRFSIGPGSLLYVAEKAEAEVVTALS
jgi:ceramide glucosyltransferase